MKIVYAITFVSLVAAGILLAVFFPFQEKDSSILHDQSESLSSLLLTEPASPHGLSAESISLFAQNVPDDVRAIPAPLSVLQPNTPPGIELQSAAVPQQSVESATPFSYFYFYTGVPVVRPVPTTTIVYTATPVPIVRPTIAPLPVVQPYAVPIFVPKVVPSRVGAPKLVYTNGVVIKPKVYYPRQPLRNSIRGVTP